MQSVVLINLFEVQAGAEDEFLHWWQNCSKALRQEKGFLDANLHRSLKTETHFRFINIAHWQSEEDFITARNKHTETLRATGPWKGQPALYEIASIY